MESDPPMTPAPAGKLCSRWQWRGRFGRGDGKDGGEQQRRHNSGGRAGQRDHGRISFNPGGCRRASARGPAARFVRGGAGRASLIVARRVLTTVSRSSVFPACGAVSEANDPRRLRTFLNNAGRDPALHPAHTASVQPAHDRIRCAQLQSSRQYVIAAASRGARRRQSDTNTRSASRRGETGPTRR